MATSTIKPSAIRTVAGTATNSGGTFVFEAKQCIVFTFRGASNGAIYGVTDNAPITPIVNNSNISVTTTGTTVTVTNNGGVTCVVIALIYL